MTRLSFLIGCRANVPTLGAQCDPGEEALASQGKGGGLTPALAAGPQQTAWSPGFLFHKTRALLPQAPGGERQRCQLPGIGGAALTTPMPVLLCVATDTHHPLTDSHQVIQRLKCHLKVQESHSLPESSPQAPPRDEPGTVCTLLKARPHIVGAP